MVESNRTLPADHPSIGKTFDIPYERTVEFDLTTFPSPDAFAALCERHGLTDTDTYVKTSEPDIDELEYVSPSKYYHFYSNDVLLTTLCHPLTGEKMHPTGNLEYREPGYASFVMLKGATEAVIALYDDIVETATHIKGGEVYEYHILPDGTHSRCETRFPDRLQQHYEKGPHHVLDD